MYACECCDRGCPVHPGESRCYGRADTTLYRVDMQDFSGTRMCDGCASDAFQSGLFTEDAHESLEARS